MKKLSGSEEGTSSIAVVGRLAAWLAAAFVCARATADPDLWGHLRFGLDLAHTRHLTSLDPYSFTQDVPWVNHEWLSELVFALAYRLAGIPGLLLLKGAILATAFGFLGAIARRAAEPYRWWALAIAIVGLAPASITFRPQLWTILGLALLCYVLTAQKGFGWLPAIFVVWANMHGGWIVGAGVAGLYVIGRIIDTRRLHTSMRMAVALAASVAATIVNPYGWGLWRFLSRTVRMTRDITEWRPLWQVSEVSHRVLWVIVVAALLGTALARWRRITWAAALPVAFLGVAGLLVSRLAWLFGELSILATADGWRPTTSGSAQSATASGKTHLRARGRVVVDIIAVAAIWLSTIVVETRCLSFSRGWAPDVTAAGAFAPPNVRGRLVLPFDWGEYAIWHWGPRLRVSIDGRRETVFSEATINLQSSAVPAGQPEGLEYLNRTRPEYVWLPSGTGAPVKKWLTANGYRLDIETGQSFIATRADLPRLATGTPMSVCFP